MYCYFSPFLKCIYIFWWQLLLPPGRKDKFSTRALAHLLLQLVEDELDNDIVFHLQQLRRPLCDPRLENVQLHLKGGVYFRKQSSTT